MRQDRAAGARVLNLADDEPAESADVVAEAARLLGVAAPDAVPFEQALATMSRWRAASGRRTARCPAGGRSRRSACAGCYPSYREGLRAILAEERGEGPA